MESRRRDGLAATLSVFEAEAPDGTPLTTSEVATHLDCTHRGAYDRLTRLVDSGEIETKKVGARGRIWWRPASGGSRPGSRRSEFELLVDAVSEYAIFALDPEGRVRTWNTGAEQIKGYSREEILGQPLSTFYTRTDVEAGLPERLLAAAAEDGSVEDEGWRVRENGTRFWATVTLTALYDDTGELTGYTNITRDVTRRRAAEDRRRRAHRSLQSELDRLFEHMDDGFLTLDRSWRCTYANDRFVSMLGLDDPEALRSEPIWDVLEDLDVTAARSLAETAMENQEPVSFERHTVDTDRWYEVRIYPTTDGVSVYVRDVTERTERERELERTADLLGHTERIANVGGWELNVGDPPHEVLWSDQLFEIFEIEPRAPLTPTEVLSYVHPADRDRVREETAHLLDERTGLDQTYRIVTGAGNVRWLRVISERPSGRDDILRGATLDVTAQRRHERKLERQREHLAVLNNLNEVVVGIAEAVIDQSTREEIERTLCERLAASDSYERAWVGGLDTGSETIDFRTGAGEGVDRYEGSRPLAPDEDAVSSVSEAISTREMQITADDGRAEAIIPIVHENICYGVLAVATDRPDAFASDERAVIGGLGEIVGHAIAAVDRKRALMGDDLVELVLETDSPFESLGIDIGTGERITFDRAVPVGNERFLLYGTATSGAMAAVETLAATLSHWSGVDRLTDDGETVRFQARLTAAPSISLAAAHGGDVLSAVVEDGRFALTLHIPPGVDVRQLIDAVRDHYPTLQLQSRRQLPRPDAHDYPARTAVDRLTDRQRTILEAAYFGGFFESPRARSGDVLATDVGISSSTFHQHLRKAERTVFEALFATDRA